MRTNSKTLLITIWVLCCAVALGQAQKKPAPAGTANQQPGQSAVASKSSPAFGDRNPRYQLHPGDVVDMSFPFSPEFNQTVTVQPDGFVTLREVGDMKVLDLTLPQLREALIARYQKILKSPEVNLLLKEFEKPYFLADGQVGHPGRYELRGPTTVVQGLALAGGFTKDTAKHSQVVLFRRIDNQWSETHVIDIKHMLANKNLSEDMELHPGDMIYVPQNSVSKITRFLPTPGVGMGITPF